MAVKLRRPILVGGLSLTLLVWLLDSFNHAAGEVGGLGMMGAIALGTGVWLFQKRADSIALDAHTLPVDRAAVEKTLAEAENLITCLATETASLTSEAQASEVTQPLREKLAQISGELDRQTLSLAVMGGKSVGKTALVQGLQTGWATQQPQTLRLTDTSELFASTDADMAAEATAWSHAIASDLVLFLAAGDLTEPELQALQRLTAANQRTVLVFNKQDQYLPAERLTILKQLQDRVQGLLEPEDVVAIAAVPGAVKVRQHQPDGSFKEWMEQPAPDLAPLTERLSQVLVQEGQQLVWATTQRSALGLKAEAKTALNEVRRSQALPLVEQFQWIAAATAFANPVPALDLLATAAISTQLVLDLAVIYQQKFSFQQAQTIAKTLASLMLKLGVVELSTQTVGHLLKSNAVTFVAGGAVQGVSAAYLTRLAGLSLIEYFQEQEVSSGTGETSVSLERLSQKLRSVFQQNQQNPFWQAFIKQALGRLSPSTQAVALPESTPL